jgi:hypothetical protein
MHQLVLSFVRVPAHLVTPARSHAPDGFRQRHSQHQPHRQCRRAGTDGLFANRDKIARWFLPYQLHQQSGSTIRDLRYHKLVTIRVELDAIGLSNSGLAWTICVHRSLRDKSNAEFLPRQFAVVGLAQQNSAGRISNKLALLKPHKQETLGSNYQLSAFVSPVDCRLVSNLKKHS